MTEPITGTTAATLAVTGVTFVGLLSGLDAGVLIGAFAGSVVFVLTADDLERWKRVLLFMVSVVAGVIGADMLAKLVSVLVSIWLPTTVEVNPAVGALIASAVSVRVLMKLTAKPQDGGSFLDRFKGPQR
ncbi:hypothetical protein EKL29_21285 [Pantoea sp. YU22]|uniref:phage holin family protein n=1 Tax=Pantoea sp. YU22 TaxID=2497684 RepID=UPI000F85F5D8|nr:phage holin family protein [Pantoea sp. YU22]RTY53654.1 hypothetical protein EKL29_21285 [Pantoea sp. YU22]